MYYFLRRKESSSQEAGGAFVDGQHGVREGAGVELAGSPERHSVVPSDFLGIRVQEVANANHAIRHNTLCMRYIQYMRCTSEWKVSTITMYV